MEIHLPQSNTCVPQPFQLDPPKLCYQEVQKIQAGPKANMVPGDLKNTRTHAYTYLKMIYSWSPYTRYERKGRKLTWKFKSPKKFNLTNGFLRDQTYTNIIVNAWPRNNKLTKNANVYNNNLRINTYNEMHNGGAYFIIDLRKIINKTLKGYDHTYASKNEHHYKVSCPSAKWSFL